MQGNFVVRTASYWADHGDAYAIFDAPSDSASGMQDVFRLSADASADVGAAVSELRKRYPGARLALVGTSRGTITVGNVLKRHPALADAFVLTSPVTQANRGQAGLSGLRWNGNKGRVLVLANENDACQVSPPGAAKQVAEDNGFDFIQVSSSMGGGDRKSDCKAQSPHGFLGIETKVLDSVAGWLDGKQ
jgi:alpha-beta hydrolase superfamily lysophospholipase